MTTEPVDETAGTLQTVAAVGDLVTADRGLSAPAAEPAGSLGAAPHAQAGSAGSAGSAPDDGSEVPGREVPGAEVLDGEVAGPEVVTDLPAGDAGDDELPSTGSAEVDAALRRLAELDGLPVDQHPDRFDRVAADLHEVLADAAPAGDGR